MKAILTFSLGLIAALASAQDPATSYTNGTNNIPPFNGTNPPGHSSNSVTLPNAYPSSTGTNPINPGSVSPTGSNTPFPTSPGVPQVNHLFPLFVNDQNDPSRTPKSPRRSDPVRTLDGSGGKYRSQHKVTPAKKNGFVSNRRTRGVRPRVSHEKTSSR